jgi:hypothetical protein
MLFGKVFKMKMIFITVLLFTAVRAQFDWQDNGLPLRQGVHIEWQRSADSVDGELIFVWSDTRDGDKDVFIQKINVDGEKLWGENGATVVATPGRQEDPMVISDGAGGAFVVWIDYRYEPYYGDIFGQYVNSNGEVMWDETGVPLSIAFGRQDALNVCPDGNGGAFVIWNDQSIAQYGHTYGTHLTTIQSEIIAPETGVPILEGPGSRSSVSIETGGVGFATLVFEQRNEIEERDIYSQRIDSACNTIWSASDENGVVICSADGDQFKAKVNDITSSVSAVVWEDRRNGEASKDIYFQFIDEDGNVLLQNDGIVICDDPGNQNNPRVKAENGDAFVVWEDFRNNINDGDIFTQKITLDGTAQWDSNGLEICSATGKQTATRLTTDNFGGVYIVWQDERFSPAPEIDIFTQHINSDGLISFEPDGLPICILDRKQESPIILPDSVNGAFVMWADYRTGGIGIYVQRVMPDVGIMFEDQGLLFYSGIDGNSINVQSVYLGNDQNLAYWEDNRSGFYNPAIYAALVDENFEDTFETFGSIPNIPLGTNEFQTNPQIARVNNHLFMNFKSIDQWGTILQYYQILDINDNFNTVGDSHGQPVFVPNFASNQSWSKLTAGDDGYFYLSWSDFRFEISWSYLVFAQKFDELGNPQWQEGGVLVGELPGDNIVADIKAVPGGGCFVTWVQNNAGDQNIFTQFLDANGYGWGEVITLSAEEGNQSKVKVASIENGIFAVWQDSRNGNDDIFGQVILYDGTVVGEENGFEVSVKNFDQRNAVLTYNPENEYVLVCWQDFENGVDFDVFCRIFDSETLLAEDEITMAVFAGSDQTNPFVYTSLDGSYMVSWEDTRNSIESDLYYQEIQLDGQFSFEEGGTVICDAPFKQENPMIDVYSHFHNRYMVYWLDSRSSDEFGLINLYVQSRTVEESESCGSGNVNFDDYVDLLDVVIIVAHIQENGDLTDDQFVEADMNCDLQIDVMDIVLIVELILGG